MYPLLEANMQKQLCKNHKKCGGRAEPGRDKCACCIAADEQTRDAERLAALEQKPRKVADVWGR